MADDDKKTPSPPPPREPDPRLPADWHSIKEDTDKKNTR